MPIVTERAPEACPNGHLFEPGTYLVGWDGTQRVYHCRECGEVISG